ncbi:HDOD domain-containing protein [Azospira sp. APE16]|jgi:HD-like signal output (HDOD) protein|uniref:HD-like signal output (HDOD) protein n=2 Tax=Azospira oryzae TaxID=146939 RepID=A0ABY0ISP2_9RHOO|nr:MULTISPECIES: HDOD domain-containing protein [Azospira]TLS17252.1 MAG: HDOD domain-containing protein [Betaproteobacteria bacterium]AEV27742.1 putative signal transduction protein [Azospira oryzae PS]MBP7489661.1 HDOD domain-containing protein [Azospira sp.]MDK9689634.1 HDOD domain-containing protein [Azospira sp.]PZR29679.1 MAG: HDOD domain-containing protein [Azospira oryzae]
MTSSASAAATVESVPESRLQKDEKTLQRLLSQGVKLPPQPKVVEELERLLRSDEADLRALARVISQDAGITAMLFKAVQSSAYRQHQPFDNLEKILQAIGLKQTLNLVQAIALMGANKVSKHRKAYERFWSRSQTIAQLAMLIADERVMVCNVFPDQAYLAGIFHDCGVPLLMERFPSYCRAMHLEENDTWIDLLEEDKKYQADHCVVGYFVARHWHLPEFICEAIRFHHDLPQLVPGDSRSLAAIIQLAIHAYHQYLHLDDPDWGRVVEDVQEELGIHADDLPEYLDVLLERFQHQS